MTIRSTIITASDLLNLGGFVSVRMDRRTAGSNLSGRCAKTSAAPSSEWCLDPQPQFARHTVADTVIAAQ